MTSEISKSEVAYFNLESKGILSGNYRNVNVHVDLKNKVVKMTGERLVGHSHDGQYTPKFEQSERTYKVGDTVAVGSYNLTYTGTILNISGKVVKVSNGGRTEHMRYDQFVWYNLNLNLEKIKKSNAEWMD